MLVDALGFIVAFLFSLSCVFSIVAKLYDVDEIFNSKSKTIKLLLISSIVSLIFAVIYLEVISRIF